MRRAARDAGSIVIEAMVAALIVAGIAGALFQTVATDARAERLTGERRQALLVAQSQLAAAGIATPLAPGIREGHDGDLVWRVATSAYEADGASDVDPVWRVTATVRSAGARRPSATLSTLRLAK